MQPAQRVGKAVRAVQRVGLTSDWMKSGASLLTDNFKRSNAKPRQTQIAFNTRVKIALNAFIRFKIEIQYNPTLLFLIVGNG